MAGEGSQLKPISLFYSYSHEDEYLRLKLQKHLAPLKWSGMISQWHDRKIEAGKEWEKEIDHHLSSADIILLLVSASFIASEYCRSVEIKKALERHQRGDARVIPVILKPCRWDRTPFARLQATPKNAKPVTQWRDWDTAFDDVVSKIESVVGELRRSVGKAVSPVANGVKPKVGSQGRDPESFNAVVALVGAHREGLLQAKLMSAVHLVHFEPGRIEMRLAESAPDDLPRQLSRFLNEHTRRRWLVTVSRPGGGLLTSPHVFADFAVFRDIDAPWCPEMVALPAGGFLMGSPESEEGRIDYYEGPQHQVTIHSRFAMGRYPVTFDEFDHFCMTTKREKPEDEGWGRGRRPVINVSWHDAQAYVDWLTQVTGKSNRLPSEAEWEYACRAGTTTPFSFGKTITPQDANYSETKLGKTTEVGSFAPNPWGLYDMHGNVWEWCADGYRSYTPEPVIDPMGALDPKEKRLLRGGSWISGARDVRSACRYAQNPSDSTLNFGFRCTRVLT